MMDLEQRDAPFASADKIGGEAMRIAATNQSNEPVREATDMDAEMTSVNPEAEPTAPLEETASAGEEEVAARLGDFA